MTVRPGTLYLGVFFLAAGGVTLGAATGALDRSAVAGTLGALWPIAVIAVGAGLVLRRSRAALVAGVLAAAVPGLALGASFAAVPEISIPCAEAASPASTAPAGTWEGAFGTNAAVSLALSCGELTVTAQPGSAWRLDARDGATRRTDVTADATRLSATTNRATGGWAERTGRTGRADWAVALPTGTTLDMPTGTTLDLRIELDAGSLALRVPDQLALRVRSTAALGSIDVHGLVKRGSAWETPGYDAATNKADLAIEASVGSVTINPEGGCK